MGKVLLGEDDFNMLQKLIGDLLMEADKCASVQAYLAACVLLGSALEAMLLAMVSLFPEEVGKVISGAEFKNLGRNPKSWNLHDLLIVSFKTGWIPFKDTKDPDQGELGDWLLNYVKELRNLIHPGKKIRDYKGIYLTKEHFESARIFIDLTIKHLLSKIEKSLAEELGLDAKEGNERKSKSTN